MKILKSFKVIYLLVPLILLLGLSIGGIWYLHPENLWPRSYADLSINQNQLVVNLNIIPQDQVNFNQFVKNLNLMPVSTQFQLQFDNQTLSQLKVFLPTRVYLKISPTTLLWQSQSQPALQSSLSLQDFHYASGSGSLDLESNDSGIANLKINNPDVVVNSATSSGQLYLSTELLRLFPSLQKISTINVEINGRDINGEMELK